MEKLKPITIENRDEIRIVNTNGEIFEALNWNKNIEENIENN